MKKLPHLLVFACAIFSLVGLSGCAYSLGEARPSMMRGVNTISVPVSHNKTLEPNVESVLADSITKAIQNDGTYSVAYSRNADAVLETTLTNIKRSPARSVRGNVLATSEYELTVTIAYLVREVSTGRTLLSGDVDGKTSFFVSSDLQTAVIQALPLAFDNAAIKLASRLSEGF